METEAVMQHLGLVCVSFIFTAIFGLLLGIIGYNFKRTRFIILWFVDILQTIPVLALLGIIMIFFGATFRTVVIGIVLYSLLPVVRNTIVGLEQIDPAIREAAIGMGMTKRQRLYKIEFPLAFPIIFTGLKISVITSIGIAVFGAVVGGGGLGYTINRAIMIQDGNTLFKATLALVLMSLAFDLIMGLIEKKLDYSKRRGSV
ncbi:MAG: ABC transporter permease [Bacilli bacterium]|jgi:osmoprotectant transport system permease protein|nr:ABC transporter permease [Bacilli bacterium]